MCTSKGGDYLGRYLTVLGERGGGGGGGERSIAIYIVGRGSNIHCWEGGAYFWKGHVQNYT